MGVSNKKIINASSKEYKGIKFKSKLECTCYKKLEQSNLQFSYESEKITLCEGFYPQNVEVYAIKNKRSKEYGYIPNKIRDITYTPDFIIRKDKYVIYVDVKGFANDTYPLKKKMFLKYLNDKKDKYSYIFMEPHNVKQIMESIKIIQSL